MTDPAVQSVDQLASRIIEIERTPQPAAVNNAAFADRFRDPERNPFPGWNPRPRAIHAYQLSDVVLDGNFRGLFNANGFVQGTGYLVPDDVMQRVAVDTARVVPPHTDANVIIGCNTAHHNYFHWITQAVPAIDHAVNREGQAERICIALPPLNDWQEESLRLLDLGGVRRVTIDDKQRQYAFAKVEYSEILNGGAAFSQSATTRRTYMRLRESVERPATLNRKLYVARLDSTTRPMRNEAAVIEEVQRRGFEVVTPGSLSLTEQIALFRSAGIIVGPHGAGLANIVFCEAGTVVYELLSTSYTNACFCNLATIAGLRYWADAFASDGDGLPNLRPWESDTRLVAERLDEIELVHSQLQHEAQQRTIGAMDFLRGLPGQVASPAISAPDEVRPRQGLLGRMLRAIFRR